LWVGSLLSTHNFVSTVLYALPSVHAIAESTAESENIGLSTGADASVDAIGSVTMGWENRSGYCMKKSFTEGIGRPERFGDHRFERTADLPPYALKPEVKAEGMCRSGVAQAVTPTA